MGGHRGPSRSIEPDQDAQDQLAHQVQLLRSKTMHLERALQTSRSIGVAMGIVMSTHKVNRERAFDFLRTVSQHQNRKLYEVADEVIETGTLPLVEALDPPLLERRRRRELAV